MQPFIFTQHFKNYLFGQQFLIITVQRALVWIYSFKEPDNMVARGIEKLRQFNFDFKHRAGKKVPNADCLSRINTKDDEKTAFVNAIVMDAEQDNTNHGSRG